MVVQKYKVNLIINDTTSCPRHVKTVCFLPLDKTTPKLRVYKGDIKKEMATYKNR